MGDDAETKPTEAPAPAAAAESEDAKPQDSKDEDTTPSNGTKEEKGEKASSEVDEAVLEAVKGRLKFFLSDANVRQDRFVRDRLMPSSKQDISNPGFISVESLLKFNTIRKHTTDPKVIVQVVKTMLSDTLKLDEDETAIGRVVPFTKELMDKNIPLSLYVKGLPFTEPSAEKEMEGEKFRYTVTMDDVRALFEPYGPVTLVRLKYSSNKPGEKRSEDKGKKGPRGPRNSYPIGEAVIEFEKEEDMQKAVDATLSYKESKEIEPKTPLTIGDPPSKLTVMLLSEYITEIKKKRELASESKPAKDKESGKKREREEDESGPDFKPFTCDWKPGCVIRMEGLPVEKCSREALLEMVAKGFGSTVDEIKEKKIYVDYSRGQKDGALRFPDVVDEIEKIAKDLASGDLKVADEAVSKAYIISGDEEKEYWTKFIDFKNNQIKQRAKERSSKKYKRGGRR